MLEGLFPDRNRDPNDRTDADRDARIRERMRADGINEEEATRLVISEEELAIGKREVRAGEVAVNKRVETEHVREGVDLHREEVEIERRPITGATGHESARIGDDGEIHVPLHAEEAVIEKRVVPTEEIVIRKNVVTEHQTVEDDLRRERAEVHAEGNVRQVEPRTDRDRTDRDRVDR
jgi:uncharacterized protein (TIGR02271 family)